MVALLIPGLNFQNFLRNALLREALDNVLAKLWRDFVSNHVVILFESPFNDKVACSADWLQEVFFLLGICRESVDIGFKNGLLVTGLVTQVNFALESDLLGLLSFLLVTSHSVFPVDEDPENLELVAMHENLVEEPGHEFKVPLLKFADRFL